MFALFLSPTLITKFTSSLDMAIQHIKIITDLVYSGIRWLRDFQDPARDQASRIINAFEAHGIPRQQILRILPTDIEIPFKAFSNVENLRNNLSLSLLDWSAEFLALNRNWLDGVGKKPHQFLDGYKNESIYIRWFESRIMAVSADHRKLVIWSSNDLNNTPNSNGYLSIVYVESNYGYDGNEISRYWSLSDRWRADHKPCIDSMSKIVEICCLLDILVIGRIVKQSVIERYETGQLFAPEVNSYTRSFWYPEDLVEVRMLRESEILSKNH